MKNRNFPIHYNFKKIIINLTAVWFILLFSFHYFIVEILNESLLQTKFLLIYVFLLELGFINFRMLQYYFNSEKHSFYYSYKRTRKSKSRFGSSLKDMYLTIKYLPN